VLPGWIVLPGRAACRSGRRQAIAGRRQHAEGQVNAEDAAAEAAPGQFRQVHAVAAADVHDRAGRVGGGQVEHAGRQVDARVLVDVDRLAGRQVRVGLVLGAAQVIPVFPRVGHPEAPSLPARRWPEHDHGTFTCA
jgi:hypothetical protein